MTDDGKVYRMNEDGSFTSIGNVEDLEKTPTTTPVYQIPPIPTDKPTASNGSEIGWWKRNYNWLWFTTLILLIGWFISCLSCSEYQPSYWYVDHYEYDEYHSYAIIVLEYCFIILLSFGLSWLVSSRTKTILKLLQIPTMIIAIWFAYIMIWYLDPMYAYLLFCLASVPFVVWIITLCLSIFRRK